MSGRIEPKSAARYFEEERELLRHLGREFGAAHPHVARLLQSEGDDPSVERLLQGVAFLTSRIRQRLDQSLPELSHELFRLLWPDFLRPVPSMVMQRFEAPESVSWTHRVAAKAQVRSAAEVPGGSAREGRCVFQTVQEVTLPPARIVAVAWSEGGQGDRLGITFELNRGLTLDAIPPEEISGLRLYLAGPTDGVAREILYYMHHRTAEGQLRLGNPDRRDGATIPLPPARAVGLHPKDALLPGWERAPEAYRILQEYFAFPQRFQFVDVVGLSPLSRLGAGRRFELAWSFDRPFPHRARVGLAHVLLGCTPAVNLFASSAVIRRRTPAVLEAYPLRPRGPGGVEQEVFSVEEVVGVAERSQQRVKYGPLLERAMQAGGMGPGSAWYQEQVQVDPDRKRVRTSLRLSELDDPDRDEVLSIQLLCTNGLDPIELPSGAIRDASGLPAAVTTTNLGVPTPPIPPPLDRELEWRLLAHLAVSRSTISTLSGLKRLLTLYNHAAHARAEVMQIHQRRMSALISCALVPSEELVARGEGSARREGWCMGAQLELTMDFHRFGGVGEVYLFGMILNEVLAHWVVMNSFCRLVLRDHTQGAEPIVYPVRIGEQGVL